MKKLKYIEENPENKHEEFFMENFNKILKILNDYQEVLELANREEIIIAGDQINLVEGVLEMIIRKNEPIIEEWLDNSINREEYELSGKCKELLDIKTRFTKNV